MTGRLRLHPGCSHQQTHDTINYNRTNLKHVSQHAAHANTHVQWQYLRKPSQNPWYKYILAQTPWVGNRCSRGTAMMVHTSREYQRGLFDNVKFEAETQTLNTVCVRVRGWVGAQNF